MRNRNELRIKGKIDKALHTSVQRIGYDCRTHTGSIHMDRNCCCDMGGAIELFEGIDPAVDRISTYADFEVGTVYVKVGATWQAQRGLAQAAKARR